MSKLFRPYRIGSMEIRNRFMRSATTSAWSDERGIIRPEIVDLYRGLAEGGVGLIVKGHLYVTDSGKAHAGMAGISGDHHVPGLRKITDIVHENGGKIVAQVNHAGYNSIVERVGPSEYDGGDWRARALSSREIEEIVRAFGDAADRTMEAGFDGVQIHGAHGYLISQFLSRLSNRRTDEWGGSLEKRTRLLDEVYEEVRSRVGGSVPVLLKMNCDDFSPGGFTVEDSAKVAEAICKRGIDLLELSGGGIGQQRRLRERARHRDPVLAEASFAGHAERIRASIKPRPLALVNGVRSRRCMDAIIERGIADVVSMSRPFIREPDLVRRLEAGEPIAMCTSCDACEAEGVFTKTMLRCQIE